MIVALQLNSMTRIGMVFKLNVFNLDEQHATTASLSITARICGASACEPSFENREVRAVVATHTNLHSFRSSLRHKGSTEEVRNAYKNSRDMRSSGSGENGFEFPPQERERTLSIMQ